MSIKQIEIISPETIRNTPPYEEHPVKKYLAKTLFSGKTVYILGAFYGDKFYPFGWTEGFLPLNALTELYELED